MSRHSSPAPKYCLHKPTGRAFVRIRGKFRYLGKYDSLESRRAYKQILDELAREAYGRVVGQATDQADGSMLTVVELCARYLDHADAYYVKDGHRPITPSCSAA